MYQISPSIMLVTDQTVLSPDQMFCTHPVAISKKKDLDAFITKTGASQHTAVTICRCIISY